METIEKCSNIQEDSFKSIGRKFHIKIFSGIESLKRYKYESVRFSNKRIIEKRIIIIKEIISIDFYKKVKK